MFKKYKILIVDDEKLFHHQLRTTFGDDYDFYSSFSKEDGLKRITERKSFFDLILLDLNLNDEETRYEKDEEKNVREGIKVLKQIQAKVPSIPIIVATKFGKMQYAVDAMKEGAKDFLYKRTYDPEYWDQRFTESIKEAKLERKNEKLTAIVEKQKKAKVFDQFITKTDAVEKIKKQLVKLSEFPNITVLLTGETGVGKEVAAHYLHKHGARKDKDLIAVNLSAIQETLLESTLFGYKKGAFSGANKDYKGLFEQANGGILFLDEIGEIDTPIQIKLLRFLEDRKIRAVGSEKEIELDVQVIAATNKNLKTEIKEGRFREDLYQRLNNYPILLPPLRERRNDITPLIQHFSKTKDINSIIEEEVIDKIKRYHWRGNIRELKNTVESMLIRATIMDLDKVSEECLPKDIQRYFDFEGQDEENIIPSKAFQGNALQKITAENELRRIEKALIEAEGRKGKAAELLGMTDQTLRYKVKINYYEKYPDLFIKFPTICKVYKLKT